MLERAAAHGLIEQLELELLWQLLGPFVCCGCSRLVSEEEDIGNTHQSSNGIEHESVMMSGILCQQQIHYVQWASKAYEDESNMKAASEKQSCHWKLQCLLT